MEGVILFADDKLLDYSDESSKKSSLENKLFRSLSESSPVLGVKKRKWSSSLVHPRDALCL